MARFGLFSRDGIRGLPMTTRTAPPRRLRRECPHKQGHALPSWRLFTAVQDPRNRQGIVRHVRQEHGVVATARGDSSGSSGPAAGGIAASSSSSGRSENRSEIRRALIRPEEIIQDTRADEAFVLVRGARPLRCWPRDLFSPPGHDAPGGR